MVSLSVTLWLNRENKMQVLDYFCLFYTQNPFSHIFIEYQCDLTWVYIQHGEVFPSVGVIPVVTYCHTQAAATLLHKETKMEWFEWGRKDGRKDGRKEFRQIPQRNSLAFSSQCFIHLWLRQTEKEQWDQPEISWWFLQRNLNQF